MALQLRQRLVDLALAAPVSPSNADALRSIALALAKAGERERSLAFAGRYAQACREFHRSTTPLLWPQRTAGRALRVGLLRLADDPGTDALRPAFEGSPGAAEVEWRVLELRSLPPAPEAAARAIAALDLDVLIDAAGLAHPVGPLLALRPARALWGIDRPEAPAVAALVDRVFAASGPAAPGLVEALAGCDRDVASAAASMREAASVSISMPASPATAGELALHWEAAVRAHQAGDAAAARAEYDWILARQPGHAPAHYLRAVLERDQGSIDAAVTGLEAAVAAAPGFDDARAALANLLVDRGEAPRAHALAGEGLALSTRSAALWRALGQAGLKQGDAAGATAAFAEAIAREPDNAEAHYNHGVALQMQHDLAGAARAYQRALAFRPGFDAAEFNLGVVFDQQGHADAAITAFTRVLARAPRHVAAYKALGETLLASGRIDAWARNFERFLRHCPDHLAAAVQGLEVCAYRGDHLRLGRILDDLRRERYTAGEGGEVLDALQQLIYLLHFFDVEPGLITGYERTHAALARRIYGEPWPRATTRRPGRLRVGYLSGDFRNHVMGKMMWEVLRRHDRGRFEVFGYATTDAHDAWTDRIGGVLEHFEGVARLSDAAAAARIAQDDLDLLVDLSTHTKGSRPGILARKPARVQVTHVASAGTTALSTIDFKLTDRHADVEGAPASDIEALLAMDGCVYPWRSIEPAPVEVLRREALGIAAGATVIGAFSAPLKLSQRCLATWRELLARLPAAVLAFSPVDPALRSTYARLAKGAGIDVKRIVFIPQGRDDGENQARYRLVDFVLDPMPYGGVNGTMEALAMGVPVVTLVGLRHAERSSYSILTNLGVTATIAHTGPEYVDIAIRLATDAAFMREVRDRIAQGLAHSPLTDMDLHTRNLERAYVAALAHAAPEALAAVQAMVATGSADG